MIVREAVAADGAALLRAMASCPQGNDLVVTLTNAPDFFARSRIYEQPRVFLAEEDGQIAGSAAYAIRTIQIDGRPVRTGFEFQYFVSANFQRRGVASRLREQIERSLTADGAELTTAIIMCSNQPSIGLFERSGFACARLLSITMLQTDAHSAINASHSVRPARPTDLPAVARLCNETWASSDYVNSISGEAFAAAIERTPGCSLETVYVLEEAGQIVATAGLWRWRDIQQINVVTISDRLAERLPGIRAGESWRHWGLTPVGFCRPDDLARLLGPLCNRAHASGIDLLGVVVDPAHPITDAVRNLPHFEVAIGLFVKPLTDTIIPANRPIFVDVTDI
jgi:ribosomal protein S18 acetylase RimI-like enzyme